MSFDYFVAVHRRDWPTAESVQLSLERRGYPLRLVEAPAVSFKVENFREGLHVIFEGRPVTLEADMEQATDADDPDSLFGYIAECASKNFTISNGDFFLTLTFRSDADQVRAGLYLAAAMILEHNGYGFENQAETHGGADFAHQLLLEAADAAAFQRPAPEVLINPDFRFPEEEAVKPSSSRSIIGRILRLFGGGKG